MRKLIFPFVLALAALGQAQTVKPQPATAPHKPAAAKSDVDDVIALVKGGMTEAMIVKQLQRSGKAIPLSPADLVKLQKAGVSERIIDVMADPKASIQAQVTPAPALDIQPGGAGPAPALTPPVVEPPAATAFPPDIPVPPTTRKQRVVVAPFDFGGQKAAAVPAYATNPWLYWYGVPPGAAGAPAGISDDVGKGIKALVMSRLQQANMVTVLERNAAIDDEGKRGASSKADQGRKAAPGKMLGADCLVVGDVTVFGRDDKVQKKGFLAGIGPSWRGFGVGGFGQTKKEEKAVVAIEFRLVDAETSEVLLTANARGESTRKSKSLGIEGLGAGTGGAGGGAFQNAVTSSGFAETILGEATIDAVDKIVKSIDEKMAQLPVKQRKIQGRLASIAAGTGYLALGSNDGVLQGDRFEIMQINNEIVDPETKDPIDVEAVKVGELVVSEVREKTAIGNYGGQPLSAEYLRLAGKGYQARLMSK